MVKSKIFCTGCYRTIKQKCECGDIDWVVKLKDIQRFLNRLEETLQINEINDKTDDPILSSKAVYEIIRKIAEDELCVEDVAQ